MAVTLSGTSGLFTRVGVWSRIIRTLNGARGQTAPNPASSWGGTTKTIFDLNTAIQNVFAQYPSTQTGIVDGLQGIKDSIRSSIGSQHSAIATKIRDTIIQMVDADAPLATEDIGSALDVLIAQMTATTDYVKKPTVSATPTVGALNVGTWKMIASVLNPKGVQNDYVIPETATATITDDDQHTATLRSEPLTVRTPAPTSSDALDWSSPSYSGSSVTMNLVDPTLDNQANLLTNSDFETWTVPNTPDNWPVLVGVVGTDIKKTTTPYFGSAALEFVGDAATFSSVAQPFETTPGTLGALEANTVYAFGFWSKVDVVPAAGVLKVSLIDGAAAVITDDATTANESTVSLPGETTAYAFHGGFFRTPKTLPAVQKFRVALSAALSVGSSVYIDGLAFCKPTQLYAGGPYFAAFPGSVAPLIGDTYSVAMANNWETVAIFQLMMQQVLDMRALGRQIPSNAAPTVLEALIV